MPLMGTKGGEGREREEGGGDIIDIDKPGWCPFRRKVGR